MIEGEPSLAALRAERNPTLTSLLAERRRPVPPRDRLPAGWPTEVTSAPVERPSFQAHPKSYTDARRLVFARAGGRCEACKRRLLLESMHASHRLPRSAGRNDVPANLLAFCLTCHEVVHHQPKLARQWGWAISRYDQRPPEEVPVYLREGWWLVPADGGDLVATRYRPA